MEKLFSPALLILTVGTMLGGGCIQVVDRGPGSYVRPVAVYLEHREGCTCPYHPKPYGWGTYELARDNYRYNYQYARYPAYPCRPRHHHH